MQVKFSNAQQVDKKLKKLTGSTEELCWAVAWATDMKFAKKLLENEEKICQLVIGTNFTLTLFA